MRRVTPRVVVSGVGGGRFAGYRRSGKREKNCLIGAGMGTCEVMVVDLWNRAERMHPQKIFPI